MSEKQVVIIDYDLGNLFSVKLACEAVGLSAIVSSDKKNIAKASALILPGVGSFGDAIYNLNRLDLVAPILDFVQTGKPLMGVCLGMQLLFTSSEEFGATSGLNIIQGEIKKLKSTIESSIKIPQIGWNKIGKAAVPWEESPLRNTPIDSYMYFVHSYYADPQEKNVVLTLTSYGENNYCSSVYTNNIFATQFHPEKSAAKGVDIYKQWATLNHLT